MMFRSSVLANLPYITKVFILWLNSFKFIIFLIVFFTLGILSSSFGFSLVGLVFISFHLSLLFILVLFSNNSNTLYLGIHILIYVLSIFLLKISLIILFIFFLFFSNSFSILLNSS